MLISDYFLDNGPDSVTEGVTLTLCNAAPANFAAIDNTISLSSATGIVPGDFTVANGTPNGRRVTLGAKTCTNNNNAISRTMTHAVLDNGTDIIVWDMTPSTIGTTGTSDVDPLYWNSADPA